MPRVAPALLLQAAAALSACGPSSAPCPDVGACVCDAGPARPDAGARDAGPRDGGLSDAGAADAGSCLVRTGLKPVSLTWGVSELCHELPDSWSRDMIVRIYRDGALLDMRTLPCVQDTLDLLFLPPGEYEIAVTSVANPRYHAGLRLWDPSRCPVGAPHHTEYCDPIRLRIESCDELVEMEPAALFCDLGAGSSCTP